MREIKKGDRVRFIGSALHEASPEYYPPIGTAGVYIGGGWVQWPDGATNGDGRWHAPDSSLQLAEEDQSIKSRFCRVHGKLKTKFVPHLEMRGGENGVIGTPTKYRDVLGRALVVGDVVEIFNCSGISYGDNAVCDDGTPYVMGIKASCNPATGATGYWRLLKKRGFNDVKHGERIDGVFYVKESA